MQPKILVSACLIGKPCRYNGRDSRNEEIYRLYERGEALPVCPEEESGLPTPRPAAEIVWGTGEDVLNGRARVLTTEGEDVTAYFLHGAQHAADLADTHKVVAAVLKTNSPSCGCGRIYDGTFSGTVMDGDGVTAALLKRKGVRVISEHDFMRRGLPQIVRV